MEEQWEDERLGWRRSERVSLRALTCADLAALTAAKMGARLLEAWPPAASLAGLMKSYPDLQVAVELDQCLVGALLSYPQHGGAETVTHPWTRRDRATRPEAWLEERVSDARGAASVLRGGGGMFFGQASVAHVQESLRVGRQLVVQQLGYSATLSVVRAVGWAPRNFSASAYLQQVHAGALEDARLGVYLAAGYMMRGYWEVDGELEVLMRWAYRAH